MIEAIAFVIVVGFFVLYAAGWMVCWMLWVRNVCTDEGCAMNRKSGTIEVKLEAMGRATPVIADDSLDL